VTPFGIGIGFLPILDIVLSAFCCGSCRSFFLVFAQLSGNALKEPLLPSAT
jgi:hypothetical protein